MTQSTLGSRFTKQMARNIFCGATAFFVLLFAALIFDTETRIPQRSHAEAMTPAVVRGKLVWETRHCIGCHTLLGEGAYCAPELGNVIKRRGGAFVKVWLKAMPTNTPGRRQMPQYNLSEQQLDDLVNFLEWTGGVDTERWPPKVEGWAVAPHRTHRWSTP